MKTKYISLILLTIILMAGCVKENKVAVSTNDLEKIKLELIKKQTSKEGILYSIKLINGSDFVIKQNNVFVSFPIKISQTAYKGNEYKVEAKGNKLDIKAGEKITLNIFMPFEGIGEKSLLGIDNPSIQLIGYLENVDNKHKFSIGGDLIKN
ncbi:hypothetical protein ACIQAA_13800 [Neobacillus sp. NPDC093182]|uniref:hypothetical protein n=1 Tax=Neobacillus sp. NPDC093182 TaxID=3364297 RepID=UPI003808A662